MAYVSADLNKLGGGLIEDQQIIWIYRNSAGDSEATMKGAGFVSDAWQKGMKQGDLVICFLSASQAVYLLVQTSAPSKAAPSGTLAAGVVIT